MAEPLSDCAKSAFRFITGRPRQQLKLLLQTYRELLQIELTAITARIGRGDIIATGFQNGINALETLLRPVEKQLAQLPLAEFKKCPDLAFTLGNLENIYFEKKSELLDKAYKTAQFGFASAHINNLRANLENQLDIVNQMITYIDNIAYLGLLPGQAVVVYTQEVDVNGNQYPVTRTGIITGTPNITVDVIMDDTGLTETFGATGVYPSGA